MTTTNELEQKPRSGLSDLTVGLGAFKEDWFKVSNCPSDFIPSGAKVFIGIDHASPDGDCTVKGFYDPETGEFHIQEILSSPNVISTP